MKSKRYYFLIPCFTILLLSTISAQEKTKIQEVGITFSNLDRFGITYRIGKEHKRWRFNLIQSNIEENERRDDFNNYQTENFSINVGLGREIRKSIGDDLYFRYGLDLTLGYFRNRNLRFGRQNSENDFIRIDRGWEAMLSFVGGLNYEFNDRLLMGIAIFPSFGYENSRSKDDFDGDTSESSGSGYFIRLSNGGALISVVYAF